MTLNKVLLTLTVILLLSIGSLGQTPAPTAAAAGQGGTGDVLNILSFLAQGQRSGGPGQRGPAPAEVAADAPRAERDPGPACPGRRRPR